MPPIVVAPIEFGAISGRSVYTWTTILWASISN